MQSVYVQDNYVLYSWQRFYQISSRSAFSTHVCSIINLIIVCHINTRIPAHTKTKNVFVRPTNVLGSLSGIIFDCCTRSAFEWKQKTKPKQCQNNTLHFFTFSSWDNHAALTECITLLLWMGEWHVVRNTTRNVCTRLKNYSRNNNFLVQTNNAINQQSDFTVYNARRSEFVYY